MEIRINWSPSLAQLALQLIPKAKAQVSPGMVRHGYPSYRTSSSISNTVFLTSECISSVFALICSTLILIFSAFVLIFSTSVLIFIAFVLIFSTSVLTYSTFVLIFSAFILIFSTLVLMSNAFYSNLLFLHLVFFCYI